MPNRLSNGDTGQAVGCKGLESMEQRQAGGLHSEFIDLHVVFTAMGLNKATKEIH